MDNILNNIKERLEIDVSNTDFDNEIADDINDAFGYLSEIGAGPEEGFMLIDNSEVWDQFAFNAITKRVLNLCKQYVYYKCKLAFDPPTTSYGIEALKEQIKEQYWRIQIITDNPLVVSAVTTTTNIIPEV